MRSKAILVLFGVALSASTVGARAHDDESIRVELPSGWEIYGESGEYQLESSGADVGSLLLLPLDAALTLEERLAEIERQFFATGLIELEESESRKVEGVPVVYRRYRLTMGASEETDAPEIALHQYFFVRRDVQVLLQVETGPGGRSHRKVFDEIFSSLEVLRAPEPMPFLDPPGSIDSTSGS